MRFTKRRLRLTAIALAAAGATLVAWIGGVAAWAYVRTPQLVAQLERSGRLAIRPAALGAGRVHALLLVQDRRFYSHKGVDWGIGTTITQADVKALF